MFGTFMDIDGYGLYADPEYVNGVQQLGPPAADKDRELVEAGYRSIVFLTPGYVIVSQAEAYEIADNIQVEKDKRRAKRGEGRG